MPYKNFLDQQQKQAQQGEKPCKKNSSKNNDIYEPDEEQDGDGNKENPGNQDRANNLNEFGQLTLPGMESNIHVITIVGQVEGHLEMPPQNKATKYEHIIPQLVAVEQCSRIEGLIVILNTVGGDVEAGLAIAEMIASLSKPTVSLVLGGGHSIGVPIAVAAKTSFIAPTASMTVHPIRLTGMVVGVQQSFDYLEKIQERVVSFVTTHADIEADKFREMMMTTGELARDVGTIVVGQKAVDCGLIDRLGGLADAMDCLKKQIEEYRLVKNPSISAKAPALKEPKAVCNKNAKNIQAGYSRKNEDLVARAKINIKNSMKSNINGKKDLKKNAFKKNDLKKKTSVCAEITADFSNETQTKYALTDNIIENHNYLQESFYENQPHLSYNDYLRMKTSINQNKGGGIL